MKRLLIAIALLIFLPSLSSAATSVTQHGITWTFDTDYTVGQFVNGDYYVIDPGGGVSITGISPGYTDTPRAKNGSMINPQYFPQGYDACANYSSAVNVGIGITPSTPLVLDAGESLVSTISNDTPTCAATAHDSYVKTVAVLTALSSAPAANSFRPGAYGTVKTIHNESSLDYTKLADLAVPSGQTIDSTTFAAHANYYKFLWIDHSDPITRYAHPSDSGIDNYYFTSTWASSALLLNLDFSDAVKHDLLIAYVQHGIDTYSLIASGRITYWPADGGHNIGRKWPIMFAGVMLDYPAMRDIGQRSGAYLYSGSYGPGVNQQPPDYVYFGEDGQTFYVEQLDIDNADYTSEYLGMPEWGRNHDKYPANSTISWSASYRTIGSGVRSWAGFAMAAMIMGQREEWNHEAFFDYTDRYVGIAKTGNDPFGFTVPNQASGNGLSGLIDAMWDTYRTDYTGTPPAGTTKIRYRFPGGAVITEAVDN